MFATGDSPIVRPRPPALEPLLEEWRSMAHPRFSSHVVLSDATKGAHLDYFRIADHWPGTREEVSVEQLASNVTPHRSQILDNEL